jgi:tetratricopeptide (TPR) repeat protein
MSMETLNQYLASGLLDDASILAKALLEQAPENGEVWHVLYTVCLQQKKRHEALEAIGQAAKFLPDSIDIQLTFASSLFHSGHLSRAESQYLSLIKKRSELPKPYLYLGKIAEKKGDVDKAEQYYNKALTLDANELMARAGIGLLTMHQGKLPESIYHFRQALDLLLQRNTLSRFSPPQKGFDRPEIETLLWQTLAAMAANGLHAFPTSGTLLGLEREGHLLPFDKDLDVGIPYGEMPQASRFLLANGWQKEALPMPLLSPLSFKHKASGVVLDLCAFDIEKHSEKVISGFWMEGIPGEWQRITEFPGPLSMHIEEGPEGKFWSLDDKDGWLTALYGDWRIPNPDFDTVVCAYNQRTFSLLSQCYAYNRLTYLWVNGNIKKAIGIAQYCLNQFPEDQLLQRVVHHLECV